ncbi:MAG: ABC transporter permease [Gammaproteobacteria bacterium]|nr:ABC transporter permease [Gammaproteobacteria bacterium]|tara:strand:- start:1047 stop:2225 length:1179 start_codon:yes stop_codon:yes gene_type:complete
MSRIFTGTSIIFRKEIKDSLHDRRAMLTALLPALLLPLLMTTMFSTMAATRDTSDELDIQVVGRENAPDLIQYLSTQDITFVDYEGNAKQDIHAGEVDLVLEIPEDFEERFSSAKPADIYLHSDTSIEKFDAAADRLDFLIQSYSSSIGSMRLLVRGINPAIASAVVVRDRDYSTDASRAGQILSAMQMFVLMAAFFGSAPSAIDTTAGERERNSLEPLLVHPLSSLQIMLGKYLSVASFGFLASLVTVLVTGAALDSVSLSSLGVDPKLSLSMQLNAILILSSIVLLAAALQMLMSLFSKTFKEAQSYTGLITMLPMLAVLPSLLGTVEDADWMLTIPLLGQRLLLDQVLRGDGLSVAGLLLNTGTTLLLTAAIFIVLVRILRSERVVYGG